MGTYWTAKHNKPGEGWGEGAESQWMADGCHLGISFLWNWTTLQRAKLQGDWEREKWLENKQQKVLKTGTNRGGHNCDLGPQKSLQVNWE